MYAGLFIYEYGRGGGKNHDGHFYARSAGGRPYLYGNEPPPPKRVWNTNRLIIYTVALRPGLESPTGAMLGGSLCTVLLRSCAVCSQCRDAVTHYTM